MGCDADFGCVLKKGRVYDGEVENVQERERGCAMRGSLCKREGENIRFSLLQVCAIHAEFCTDRDQHIPDSLL